MTLSAFAQEHRPRIAAAFATLTAFQEDSSSPWAPDVADKLAAMAGGKMLRGTLALVAHGAATGRAPDNAAYRLAAAIELVHNAFLAHDDIIDRDNLRRGGASMHARYARIGPDRVDEQFGVGMAICAGDVAIFRAAAAVSALGSPELAAYFFARCIDTGFGEMEDIALGFGVTPPSEDAIMRMLVNKTARYTCSMPLACGALLGGDPALAAALDSLGEDLGLLFQVRDDELGLFGETAEIGKPAGSDMREGKKTLYALYLREAAAGADADLLARAYGNPAATDEDLAAIRAMVSRLGVDARVKQFSDRYHAAAQEKIAALSIADAYRLLLTDALAFVSSRRT